MKTVIGNWKSNKDEKEALEWLRPIGSALISRPRDFGGKKEADTSMETPEPYNAGGGFIKNERLEISIAPQFPLLALLNKEIQEKGFTLSLSAQDVSPFEEGSYTGEVSARLLRGLVKYILVGHSERRKNFGETNSFVNLKVKQCLKYQLTPIVCISDVITPQGTILEGLSFVKDNFLKEISEAIKDVKESQLGELVFMYEPPSAISKPVGPIGVGEATPVNEVLKMISQIKKVSPKSKIFYGGSIKSDNVKIYLQEPKIDGVVAGSASLHPQEFLKIIKNASKI